MRIIFKTIDGMKNTAMQEFIEFIDKIDNSVFALSAPANELSMLKSFKTKATELLEKEKVRKLREALIIAIELIPKEILTQPAIKLLNVLKETES